MSATDDATEVMKLVQTISPMLVGRSHWVQGAVLADLLAMWLAGHVVRGNPKQTKKVREQMLASHLIAVTALIEPNYKMSVEPQLKTKTQ